MPSRREGSARNDAVPDVHLLAAGKSDVERILDIVLARVGLPEKKDVPDEQVAVALKNTMDFGQDPGVVGGVDVHEGEEGGRRGERLVQELEVTGVHDDL